MKIAVIDTTIDELTGEARAFLPELIKGLTAGKNEVHLITKDAPDEKGFARIEEKNPFLHEYSIQADATVEDPVPVLAKRLNEINPEVYLIWASDDIGWMVLPLLDPPIATLAVGHADSEFFYAPARHYRSFLTRVIGTTPEVCVGFVLSCVIEKERVEWIAYDETGDAENLTKTIETYQNCFEKAIEDALREPREAVADFPPVKTSRPASQSWFSKLKAKIMN